MEHDGLRWSARTQQISEDVLEDKVETLEEELMALTLSYPEEENFDLNQLQRSIKDNLKGKFKEYRANMFSLLESKVHHGRSQERLILLKSYEVSHDKYKERLTSINEKRRAVGDDDISVITSIAPQEVDDMAIPPSSQEKVSKLLIDHEETEGASNTIDQFQNISEVTGTGQRKTREQFEELCNRYVRQSFG